MELPKGTVTFFFTDIEGSTRLLQSLGKRWETVLDEHNRIMRAAIEEFGGVQVRTEGDSFFAVFDGAPAAVAAAAAAQRALAAHQWQDEPIRVRIGIHSGEGVVKDRDYVGLDVHRAARIAAASHGGQVLLSTVARGLVEHALPEGVGLRDLGEHRLKDLDRPERLFQLVIPGLLEEFPPVRTLEVPKHLPPQLTSFVGRERELNRVKDLLARARLVTLTGAGGTGKTRLALRAAEEVSESFADGVFFVPLAPISEPDLVGATIAGSLGVREQSFRPILETLNDHLQEKETLLVADNFEQLIDAAPLLKEMLDASPKLKILVTSRARLNLSGEHEFGVSPLMLPDLSQLPPVERLSEYEAVSLFVDRATAVESDFSLTEENARAVAEICARLDGLPLAIELAASRIKILTPSEIESRLERPLALLTAGPRDLPARQRTLRAAIGWSYDLLDQADQVLFRRLSVFVGGWTIEAAEAVGGPDGEWVEDRIDVLQALGSLVDNNLVRKQALGNGLRFDMLETIREYGIERLEEEDKAAEIRRRHAEVFLSLADEAEPHLTGLEQVVWLARLEREHDNLRAALRWAIDSGEPEIGLRLGASLWRFWHLRGHVSEGRQWLGEVLALPEAAPLSRARARALAAAGGLAYWQTDVESMRAYYEESLAIYRELDDPAGIAEGLYDLAFAPAMEGDTTQAKEVFEEARTLFDQLGNRRGVANATVSLAFMYRMERDYEVALKRSEEALALFREVGDVLGMLDAMHMLGRVAFQTGDIERARSSFLEALPFNEENGDLTGIAIVLDNLAAQANAEGRPERALRLAGASERVKKIAQGQAPPMLLDLPDPREVARQTVDDQAVEAAWEEGQAMTLEEALAYAREP